MKYYSSKQISFLMNVNRIIFGLHIIQMISLMKWLDENDESQVKKKNLNKYRAWFPRK